MLALHKQGQTKALSGFMRQGAWRYMGWFNRKDAVSETRLGKSRSAGSREAQATALRVSARRRLVGAAVLVLGAIIILPWVLDSAPTPSRNNIAIRFTDPSAKSSHLAEPVALSSDRGGNGRGGEAKSPIQRDKASRVSATNGVAAPVATEAFPVDASSTAPATQAAGVFESTASTPAKAVRSRSSVAQGGASRSATSQDGATLYSRAESSRAAGHTAMHLESSRATGHTAPHSESSRATGHTATHSESSRATGHTAPHSESSRAAGHTTPHAESSHATNHTASRPTVSSERITRTDDGSRALALLEGHDTLTTTLPRTAESKGNFVLQITAYPSARDAQLRRDKLHKAGVTNAYIQTVGVGSKQQYRLRVGPFSSRAAAQAAQARLRTLGYDNGFIATQ